MTVRITEAELARDVRAVLDKVERGNEVIIERDDHRPLAVIKRPQPAELADRGDLTGAELVAAMQTSPYRETIIEPERNRIPVRDVTF